MEQAKKSAAAKYVRAIRNDRKRAYATTWFNFRVGFQHEPDRPDNLSLMAAQAVEMHINKLLA